MSSTSLQIAGEMPVESRQSNRYTTANMTEKNPLQTELNYYEKNKQEYLKLYNNQFVLIKGTQFVGTFTTDAEAYRAGLEKYGNQPFLIKQVLPDGTTVSNPALTVGAMNIRL